MSNNPSQKLIPISLCHLSKESEKLIIQNSKRDSIYYVVAFRCEGLHEYIVATNYDEKAVPADLDACLTYAKNKNCIWVIFTDGVEPIQDLPPLRTEEEVYREWSDTKNDI